MTDLLALPTVRERMQGLSVESYHRLGEMGLLGKNVELLRGIVVTKMSKSPLHELVAQKILKLLLAQVPAGFEVRKEGPLTLADSEPEPDLSVVKGRPEDWANAHPSTARLVVEVAASSAALDESQAEIYAEAGIPEYWLVRPQQRAVDVRTQPSGSRYLFKTTLGEDDWLRSASLPGVEFRVVDALPGIA
jgi:Uma2 family endonuclease